MNVLNFTIDIETNKHIISPPGRYSLVGDRYTVLRCPEIESHVKNTLGIARFNLSGNGYTNTRFDYSTIPSREFHPIGKLPKLTLRFENPNGQLYNFRGINHTLSLIVRFMTPIQKKTFEKSSLNPQYNPDFFEFQQQQESSDDETTETSSTT